VWSVAVTLRNLYPPVYIMYRTLLRRSQNQSHLIPVLTASIKNEMQKIVGENGPKESSENKSTKHHPLLLQLITKEARV